MIDKFTFYRNYYEIIKYLPEKDRLVLYDAILKYMFEDEEPKLKDLLKGIWINIKMPLDTNKKNITNGIKGGRPAKEKENPKETQTITQTKPKSEPKVKANNISYFLFLISNNKYKYIYNNSNIYNKIEEWLNYKQERKEIYKQTGLQSLLTQIENQIDIYGEDQVIDLITECMANNYKGIIFDKLKNKPTYKKQAVEPEWLNKEIKKEENTNDEIERLYRQIREAHRKQETI